MKGRQEGQERGQVKGQKRSGKEARADVEIPRAERAGLGLETSWTELDWLDYVSSSRPTRQCRQDYPGFVSSCEAMPALFF